MISIVVPALNEEKLLPDCLESLNNQDYSGDYELIVVDNGSTDRTADVARRLGAKVVSCSRTGGVFAARQVGAAAAGGDIIVQADADTVYPAGWLRRIAERFDSSPGVVAVAGRFFYRDPPSWARVEYWARHAGNWLSTLLRGRPLVVSGATFAFRRLAFQMVGGYRGLSYSADQYGICARLSKVGQVLYDKQLCVWTSSRRVRGKPLAVAVGDGVGHVLRWAGHCFGQVMTGLRRTVLPAPSGSAAVWSLVALVAVFVAYGYFVPTSPVFGKVYFKGSPTAGNLVALTFDDGPNEPYTSQILGILDRYGIRATFFVIGRNVELYPGIARRMLAERHVLGNHSYSHNANHAVTQSGSKDIELAQLAIFLVTGVKPHLYRPPHGKKSPWELRSLKKESLIEVTWSVAANELRIRSAESLSEKIAARTDPGEIILLHDGYGTTHDSPRSDKSLTVQALPLLIEKLLAKGYRFVTVPELLRVPAYND